MVIDLSFGAAIAPDNGNVRTFPIKVEDGQIWLDIDSLATAA